MATATDATPTALRRSDTPEIGTAMAQLRQEVRDRPYPVVAAAAAAGFLLGGGLTLRLAATLLGAGARAAALGVVTGFASGLRAPRPLD